MRSLFQWFWDKLPKVSSDMEYPNTFKPIGIERDGLKRRDLFDPALKHFRNAFRSGEPAFADADTERRWRRKRRQVMDQLLLAVRASAWLDHLILRGSVLVNEWCCEASRDPGDVDWVVRPRNIGINDSWTAELFRGLSDLARDGLIAERAGVRFDDVRIDDIWTYDRVPGRRIVYYWTAADIPPGWLQMDFVFGEDLWTEPTLTPITTATGDSVFLWSATKEQSLAWKLLWLDTDMHPQGKDLYDAVLLAELTSLSPALLRKAFSDRIRRLSKPLAAELVYEWAVDWDAFKFEYPWIEGIPFDWQERLAKALAPSFAAMVAIKE